MFIRTPGPLLAVSIGFGAATSLVLFWTTGAHVLPKLYFPIIFLGPGFFYILIFWFIVNPFLINHFNREEVELIRTKIAAYFLNNYIDDLKKTPLLLEIGVKDDLVFREAAKLFKGLL